MAQYNSECDRANRPALTDPSPGTVLGVRNAIPAGGGGGEAAGGDLTVQPQGENEIKQANKICKVGTILTNILHLITILGTRKGRRQMQNHTALTRKSAHETNTKNNQSPRPRRHVDATVLYAATIRPTASAARPSAARPSAARPTRRDVLPTEPPSSPLMGSQAPPSHSLPGSRRTGLPLPPLATCATPSLAFLVLLLLRRRSCTCVCMCVCACVCVCVRTHTCMRVYI